MENLKEKCGIVGIYGRGLDVGRLSFFALFALQHRGQESSGIAVSDGTTLKCYRNTGLVTHVYREKDIEALKGHIAIGHNRYSTSRGTGLLHAQPVVLGLGGTRAGESKDSYTSGFLALAHNGNLPSVTRLVEFLTEKGLPTDDYSDSELMAEAIGYYVYKEGLPLKDAILNCWPLFTGAFSLVVMTNETLVAMRDGWGIRPLVMGQLNGGTVFVSETCALRPISVEFAREINPGEMVVVGESGVESVQVIPPNQKLDIFEFVYFARPDSMLLGKSVYEVRRVCGERLAREYPVKADIVVPIPDTGVPVAVGYSRGTGIPLEFALNKNRYIHRTFIEPDQRSRDLGVKMKLSPMPGALAGKRVVVIDDSIVRGTTSREIVKMFFEAGAKEVHFLVSSPPLRYPDFYGIDTPHQRNLIASHKTVAEIREFLGATSLYYLSLDGLIESTGLPREVFNLSCFTGEYPLPLGEREEEFTRAVPAC